MKPKSDIMNIHDDAKPQFVRSRKGAHNSGVSSAEPRVQGRGCYFRDAS
jgi:hypothetical protein